MSIDAVARIVAPGSGRTRRVEPATAAADTGDQGAGAAPLPGRALVAVGPSPSTGPRARPPASSPFLAQLAAARMADSDSGERRVERRPERVAGRAGSTYRAQTRLATDLEPGFLVARAF
jgi:hypothetical protein